MSGRCIGVFFFIPLALRPATDDELLERLGVRRPDGWFGPLQLAEHTVRVLSDHVCVALYFLHNELRNLRYTIRDQDLVLERDAGLPFAYAIRDAAVRVDAEVAILETHLPDLDYILERYWMVLLGDATTLAIEWFGLVYLSDAIVEGWEPSPGVLDRDELPGGPGRTLFGGRGWTRWA
jgi:hypothetical protein